MLDTMPFTDTALFENRFWLQIMGDHSRFIFFSLAPAESEYILTAQKFIILFDELLEKSHKPLKDHELEALNQNAYEAAYRLREFKLELLTMSLNSDLKSHLSPSLYNNMLNEADEYLYILNALQNDKAVLLHPLHYHMLWLSDAAEHAALAAAELDIHEKDLIDRACRHEMQFQDLYLRALTMNGYLRTQLGSFPALNRLNEQAGAAVVSFTEYLDGLRDQKSDNKILGTLLPLMADHMSREGCYYLWKLSQSANTIRKPDCDPARPRMGT